MPAEPPIRPASSGPAVSTIVGGSDRTPRGRRLAGLAAGLAAAAAIEVVVAGALAAQQGLTLAYLLEGHEHLDDRGGRKPSRQTGQPATPSCPISAVHE